MEEDPQAQRHCRSFERPRNSKTQVIGSFIGQISEAKRGTEEYRILEPRAAPGDAVFAVAGSPNGPILGCTLVAAVRAILDPFHDVAQHIVEAECVRRKRTYRGGLLPIPFAAAAVAVGHRFAVFLDLFAPGICCYAVGACGVFPLCLGEQPIGLSGLLREPSHVLLRVVPVDIHNRALTASSTAIAGP